MMSNDDQRKIKVNNEDIDSDEEDRNEEKKNEEENPGCSKSAEKQDDYFKILDDDAKHHRHLVKSSSDTGGDRGAAMKSFRRLSKKLSTDFQRRRSSIKEAVETVTPETPTGWAVLVSGFASALLGYEINVQSMLTCPPSTYGQWNSFERQNSQYRESQLEDIYKVLTRHPTSILSRSIQPSLFVGTRSVVSSAAAYMLGGPSSTNEHIRFREILTTSQDGARIALDYELPPRRRNEKNINDIKDQYTGRAIEERNDSIGGRGRTRYKKIKEKAVVLILHGINNHAEFGYMRSLMRTFANRNWLAIGMNFRGCGGIPLATPRGYNAGFTGDLRYVVNVLSARVSDDSSLFIVGNSLGANIVTKYLGEEGLSNTLPRCVAGGVTLGNPLHIHSDHMNFPWNILLGLGVRKGTLEQIRSLSKFHDPAYQHQLRKALLANTIGEFDAALAPTMIRNEPTYPFAMKVGFRDGEHYWDESSSYRYVQHVSVPLLKLKSEDDFLIYASSSRKMSYALENPNVMIVKTKCGGHLGWQESAPSQNPRQNEINDSSSGSFGVGTSWADIATADFIEAVLSTRRSDVNLVGSSNELSSPSNERREERNEALSEAKKLRSRL